VFATGGSKMVKQLLGAPQDHKPDYA